AEWSIAAVLKTVEGHTSGGSNPSLSAKAAIRLLFLFLYSARAYSSLRSAEVIGFSPLWVSLPEGEISRK
ncbi:MAG: hypothetical protein K2G35_10145, partial [Duncaniella sp.]|nr:hypothetical protein [Duncaniella sp.]